MQDLQKTIYLIRHGQSEDNIAPVFQGTSSPLSQVGRDQAESLAERISKLKFDLLVSSPLQRAKQTAERVALLTRKKITFSELFVERIRPAEVNDKPHSDKNASMLWAKWENSLYVKGIHVGDGENFDDIILRAKKALEFLALREEKRIVVVSHGYFLRTLVAFVLCGDFLIPELFKNLQKTATMQHTGITVMDLVTQDSAEAKWKLRIYNDHAHLAE